MKNWQLIALTMIALVPTSASWAQNNCFDIGASEVVCIADTMGDLDVTFEVFNTTTFPIDRIFLWPDPTSNVPTSDTEFLFSPPIAPGTTSGPLNVRFAAGSSQLLCFELSLHDSNTGDCCGAGVCLDIPNCNGEPEFVRGDCSGDLALGLPDAILLLNYLFLGASIGCQDACDFTDDGSLGLPDAISLLNYLFLGSAAPPPPFPDCGVDPSPDVLTCVMPPCP